MTHIEIARRFVATQFPLATDAIVGGSTATETRTATSDIDLLLLGPVEMLDGAASLAANFGFEGESIEVFAYTPESFDWWAARGVEQCRPVIVDMLVHGNVIRESNAIVDLRGRWQAVLQAGPVRDTHRDDMLRYVITDLIDDLRDAEDSFEQRVIMSGLMEELAALMLLTNGRWLGTGKHLARQLRSLSPDRTAALATPFMTGDSEGFAAVAERELERAGGRLREGFVR